MTATAASSAPAAAGAYLTFQLGDESYGIEILRVREIIGMLPLTRLPGAPAEVLGVINLRGRVIPVVSLRARLGLPPAPAHPHNVTIVVERGADRLGLAVDRVREVAVFPADQVEPPPEFGLGGEEAALAPRTRFLRALGKQSGRICLLLDSDRVAGDPTPA